MKKKILSITRDDCQWEYFRVGGAGGQHRDKTSSGVRVRHPESGAVGEATDSRSQATNRKTAWNRMANSLLFRKWLSVKMLEGPSIEDRVQADMDRKNLRVEGKQDGKWIEIK